MNTAKNVCVIILNWNGWKDTIECLESVFRSDYPHFKVVVCDNASSDQSIVQIQAWCEGRLQAVGAQPFARLLATALPKPIPYVLLERAAADAADADAPELPLTLISTGGNLGFAGGNNVGLRYALSSGRFDYFWLLNNDTVIEPDALRRMVERMEGAVDAGICGSTLRHYYAPELVQVAGGSSYSPWRCHAVPLCANMPVSMPIDADTVERDMAYVAGASMMVSAPFLRNIGLMTEDYFLYFEEFDWARRASARYRLLYAPLSVVYHKEGGSIGTGGKGKVSALALYYLQRNRIKFMRRFFAVRLPLLAINVLFELLRALLRRDFFEIKWSLIAILGLPFKSISNHKRDR